MPTTPRARSAGTDFYEWGYHVCGHLLSTWDYTEECGFWAGGLGGPGRPPTSLRGGHCAFEEDESGVALAEVVRLAPPHLAELVEEGLSEYRFPGWLAGRYLGSLIERSPYHAGSTPCESYSPAGSSWTTYWSSNAIDHAASVDDQLRADTAAIAGLVKAIKKPPE